MINTKLWLITVFFLFAAFVSVDAQQKKKPATTPAKKPAVKTTPAKTSAPPKVTTADTPVSDEKRDEKNDEAKVRDMVKFLEFMLNTLGSSTTSARDKEVLITQSYAKVFRDGKVQVEDDLDDERDVTTNKDIVAYLKDVDFFYNDVHFEFIIDDIKSGLSGSNKTFYKVSLKRNLKGVNTDGKAINNTIPRYIEVNYDADAQDLKIVSIYTHEIDEKGALIRWWKELSLEWQGILRKKAGIVADSVSYGDLRGIIALTALDISGNKYIRDIEPLSRMVKLQTLSVARTDISDISPLRNMTELTDVDFSNTKIADISPLKYSDKVQKINLAHTSVTDISVLQKMPALQSVIVNSTQVNEFSPLADATALQHLDAGYTSLLDLTAFQNLSSLTELSVVGTNVQELGGVAALKSLTFLNIDSTKVSNLAPLASSENLKTLSANKSLVSDLKPLGKLTHLEKVYVDHTPVRKDIADALTAINPKVLVVFDSEDLKSWWDLLSPEWQGILSKAAAIGSAPGKEELAKIPSLDSINIAGITSIRNLDALARMKKLRVLIASKTSVRDLSPLQDHNEIRYLDLSETEVSDISVTKQFSRLKVFKADKSKISNLAPLNNVVSLQKLYLDDTEIHDITAREFLEKNHSCLLIYKTVHLKRWWRLLSPEWKTGLRSAMGSDTSSTRENMHRLAELETLSLKDISISDLAPLTEFVRIKNLDFSGTAVTSLTPIASLTTLRSLHASNGPLQDISALPQLSGLEDLDISNTPVDDLKPVSALENLLKFNCGGTQIKRLDALDKVQHLDYLDCSNTKVGNLDPVSYLPLKTLKCYNTKVSARQVENFKKSKPDCSVVYYR